MPERPVLCIDVLAWEAACAKLSHGGLAVAVWMMNWMARNSERVLPFPTPDEMQFELAASLRMDAAEVRAAWDELAGVGLVERNALSLPWVVQRELKARRATGEKPWRRMLHEPPLKDDRLLTHAWTEYHLMREDIRARAWTEKTCRLWLTGKKWQQHGRELLIWMMEESTANQWQGLHPKKGMADTDLHRHNNTAGAQQRFAAAQRKLQEWAALKEQSLFGQRALEPDDNDGITDSDIEVF